MHQYTDKSEPRWSAERSTSVATLRRLTGEIERLAPESAVQSSGPGRKLWIFTVPFVLVIPIGLLLIQHAGYEKRTERDGAAVIERQIVRLMDKSIEQRSSRGGVTARKALLIPKPTMPNSSIGSPRLASSAYADQQIHLADQLAVLGKLDGSAAALLAAVDSHPQDIELRMAAVRARMRIRDYPGAKNLAQVGLQLAGNAKDRVMFEQLLKSIPVR